MNLLDEYKDNLELVMNKIYDTQGDNIEKAANVVANCISNGGILQAFGSGHSFAGAIEIAGRAGGYIPSKAIDNFTGPNGWFETVPGIGDVFINQIDIEQEDCFFIISNSGRNPLHVELARNVKKRGCKLIVFSNVADATKNAKSGDSILNYADVVVDNCGFSGDCSIDVKELELSVGPTSSIAVAQIATMITLRSFEILLKRGITPPIFKSANIDGGREYNKNLLKSYKHRLNRI